MPGGTFNGRWLDGPQRVIVLELTGGGRAVNEAYRQGIRRAGDERLLGSSELVERTLKAAGEAYDRRMRLHSAGIDLSVVIEAVCRYFGLEQKKLAGPTKQVKTA